MKIKKMMVLIMVLAAGLQTFAGTQGPYFFDWSVRNYLRSDEILPVPHVGHDYGIASTFFPSIYKNLFSALYSNDLPLSIMLQGDVGPASAATAAKRETLMNILNSIYVPRLNFCFADFEELSTHDQDVLTMVQQVRSHTRTEVKNAFIGNYHDYPGTPDYSQHFSHLVDRSAEDTFYRNSGLNVAQPSCYPYSCYIAHTWASQWGTNVAPNKRSAMFWTPLERASLAKRTLPAGHKVIPWVAGFVYNTGYEAPVPIKADLRSLIQHYRFRGLDGYYTLCYVYADNYTQYYSTDPNDPNFYDSDESYRVDMLDAWQSLDTYFNQPGTLTYLNFQTDKRSGLQWSGIQKGNQIVFLISNLGNSDARVTYPAIAGLPTYSPWVSPATHQLFTYTQTLITVQGTVTLNDFLGDKTSAPVTIQIRKPNFTIPVETHSVSLDADGHYSFTTAQSGTFDLVAVVSPHWLKNKKAGVALTGISVTADFTLINGDCDADNEVTENDFWTLVDAMDATSDEPNWNPAADLDGDGEVTSTDVSIVLANIGQTGDL